jgi:hypothetical protein
MPVAGVLGRLDQYGSILFVGEFDETTSNNVSISQVSTGSFYASEFIENINLDYSYDAYDIVNDLYAEPSITNQNTYISGQLVANTYPAYDPITSEFAMPSYGAGTGTYMRYTVNNDCIIYNEIDEVSTIN